MNRLEKFKTFKVHPRHSKLVAKLTAADRDFCEQWIADRAEMNADDFELAVNRMFMDNPNKPKHWPTIMELISSANVKRVI